MKSALTVSCCMHEVYFKSRAISFLLPQQQSCRNLVLVHLEAENKVCGFACVLACVRVCLKGSSYRILQGNAKVSLSLWNHKPGQVQCRTLIPPPSLLFLSKSLHFSPGITKFPSLYFHLRLEPLEI